MKIKFAGTVAAVLFGLSVSAAGAQSAPVKLRFGHAHPVTDSQHVAALEFARKVKERTQGGIDIQIFPNNQLGNDNTMISGVRGGTIDIEMSGNPYFTGIVSKLLVLDLPYLFDSPAHVAKVVDGPLGRSLLDELGPRTREIFLAVQLEGLTYVAAAERFGVSVTTVKNHLIRAMTRCLLLVDA